MNDYKLCPYCNHKLNNAIDVKKEEEIDFEKRQNSLSLGLCYYCTNIIGHYQNALIKVPQTVLNKVKQDTPELYRQLLIAQEELKLQKQWKEQ